jgi:hypothetical protein
VFLGDDADDLARTPAAALFGHHRHDGVAADP